MPAGTTSSLRYRHRRPQPSLDDRLRDVRRNRLPELRRRAARRFDAIADEPALHQHRRVTVLPQHPEVRRHDPPIERDLPKAIHDPLRHRRRHLRMIIHRRPVNISRRAVIEMDAHEEHRRVLVGNRRARIERNEDIRRPRHHHLETGRLQLRPEPQRHVEREILLLEMIARHPAVHPPVPGIDYDSPERAGCIDRPAGAAGKEEDASGKQQPDHFAVSHGKSRELCRAHPGRQ
jgi:hypothetical protein